MGEKSFQPHLDTVSFLVIIGLGKNTIIPPSSHLLSLTSYLVPLTSYLSHPPSYLFQGSLFSPFPFLFCSAKDTSIFSPSIHLSIHPSFLSSFLHYSLLLSCLPSPFRIICHLDNYLNAPPIRDKAKSFLIQLPLMFQ
ncbi:hypothetical protein EYC84_010129 [Monilinia fructicola]|uniref:Uncharacterized protein n=1 Tax=Monilinia fructicola TaxID=38448 RepID=A0A5M9JGF1_MONFR|nr:hypothetical protein EYC84_010129 [Monilinia fructicola]